MTKSSLKKLLVVLLAFALVISGILVFLLSRRQSCANPFPMWLEVPAGESLESPEHIQLKYAGCSFDLSSAEEEKVTVQIACTSTEYMQRWKWYFFILYQNTEGSVWHIVFATSNILTLESCLIPPGTDTLECTVSRKIFAHKGAYKIALLDRGTCDLPREELWNGEDEECARLDDCPTESGFPMYRDALIETWLAEAQPGVELTGTELVKGKEADTLKLTVRVQENTTVDDDGGSCSILFCPPESDERVLVYTPAKSYFDFYNFSKRTNPRGETTPRELAPGLNTVEYSLPKGLFQQKGEYYINCALGGFKVFEK